MDPPVIWLLELKLEDLEESLEDGKSKYVYIHRFKVLHTKNSASK